MGSSATSSYLWDTTGCYTNDQFTPSNPECFPHGQTSQDVTKNNLNAEDAGTITCSAMISGGRRTSEPFTLRVSGEQLVYCVITCIVCIVNNACYYYLPYAIFVLYTSCYGLCIEVYSL